MLQPKRTKGFTLLEILIALFVFTILATLLTAALHHFLSIQSGLNDKSTRLHDLQMTLLTMQRDVAAAIDRPVTDASGKQELSFMGDANGFGLTHTGYANPDASEQRSTLQRSYYRWHDNKLYRVVWDSLDAAPEMKINERVILEHVEQAKFSYADDKLKFNPNWPGQGAHAALPQAVKVHLKIEHAGEMDYLMLLPIAGSTHGN